MEYIGVLVVIEKKNICVNKNFFVGKLFIVIWWFVFFCILDSLVLCDIFFVMIICYDCFGFGFFLFYRNFLWGVKIIWDCIGFCLKVFCD